VCVEEWIFGKIIDGRLENARRKKMWWAMDCRWGNGA